ncbi:hypothetical protein TNCV_1161991 [Trichonephila clavipes]|nr:hypothetical protein TNCV_1161991 [Trichonephila clavipes]
MADLHSNSRLMMDARGHPSHHARLWSCHMAFSSNWVKNCPKRLLQICACDRTLREGGKCDQRSAWSKKAKGCQASGRLVIRKISERTYEMVKTRKPSYVLSAEDGERAEENLSRKCQKKEEFTGKRLKGRRKDFAMTVINFTVAVVTEWSRTCSQRSRVEGSSPAVTKNPPRKRADVKSFMSQSLHVGVA